MRVLCIYPGMDIKVNDNAHALLYLKNAGVDVAVICSRMCSLKSAEKRSKFEEMQGIPIHRIYEDFPEQSSFPVKRYDQVCRVARRFQPDVIFCSVQSNMFIANKLKADLGVPVVLLVEYAHDPTKLLRRRWYLGLKPLARPVVNVYWRWLSKNAQAIITSFIGDKPYLQHLSRYGAPVYYVPWCNHIPEGISAGDDEKNRERGIYIGSLSRRKNTQEFAETIPRILERTPVREFVVVGPGSGVEVVQRLKDRYGERIKYTPSVPRIEALELIGNSFFSYTPVRDGGWGFIGDSWGVGTPLIVTHNEYGFRDRVDSLVVDRIGNIDLFVNELYRDPQLYGRIREGGRQRALRDHSAKEVGDKCLRIFEDVLAKRKPSIACSPACAPT